MQQGKQEEALKLYEGALSILYRALGTWHPVTMRVIINTAVVYCANKRCEEAEAMLRNILTTQEQAYGVKDPRLARALSAYASILRKLKDRRQADAVEKRAQALVGRAVPPDRR
jgi:hypothetical protein